MNGGQNMLSNIKVAKLLQEYAKEVNQNFLLYKISEQNEITIYTHTTGILIGKAGYLVQKYETMLNELVAEDNRIIREINDKRETAYKENYGNVDEEHRHELRLLRYENVARINFVEVENSLIDSMYDPMSECM